MAFDLPKKAFLELEAAIKDFHELTEVESVFVCDKGGNIIITEGDAPEEGSEELLGALTAGAFAATNELIKAVGEEHPEAIFHRGKDKGIYLGYLSEETILFVIFGDRTNLGLVKVYARKLTHKLSDLFAKVESGEHRESEDETASFVIKI